MEDDFDCRNGICVAAQARCDGNPDCRLPPGGFSSDEEDCGEDHSINVGAIVALVAVIVVFAVGVGFGYDIVVVFVNLIVVVVALSLASPFDLSF